MLRQGSGQAASRRVGGQARQPQPTLQRSLEQPQALDLGQRHHVRGRGQHPGRRHQVPGVEPDAEPPPRQRCQPARPGAHAPVDRRQRRSQDPGHQPLGQLARRYGQQGPGHLLLCAAAVARDVDLDAHPAERPPQQWFPDPYDLDAARGDGLAAGVEQAVAQPETVGGLRDGEAVLAEEPAHGERAHGQQHRDRAQRDAARCLEVDRRGHQDREQQQPADHDRGTQQQGGDQRPRGDGDQHQLGHGRHDGPVLGQGPAGGQVEQPGAQPQRVVLAEEGQRRLGVPAADHLEPQLGQPQDPGVEGAHDVHRLHPGQRDAAAAGGEHPALDLELGAGDPVAHGPPRQVAQQERGGDPDAEQQGDGPVVEAAPRALLAEQREQDQRELPASQQRGQRVQPDPAVGEWRRSGSHTPAWRASPRAARRSRRRVASAASRPGTVASVAAAAVCIVTVASPSLRSSGPAVTSTYCMRP